MPETEFLSNYLLERARELVGQKDEDEDPQDHHETQVLIAELTDWVQKGRFSSLSPEEREHWSRHLISAGKATHLVNDALTIDALSRVEAKVKRLLRFSELWTQTPPDPETAVLLREAISAYVEGLPGAAVALARATLERSLKVALARRDSTLGLDRLIDEACVENLMDERGASAARRVKRLGDQLMHQGRPEHQDGFDAIVELREVLRQLGRGGLGEQSHS